MRWLGRQLLRLRYVRTAVQSRADLARFRCRPRRRLLVGIILVFFGLVLGWPAVTLTGALAVALQEPRFVTFFAPAIYGFSWLVYLAGFVVGGPEALRYARDFNRWLARVIAQWLNPEAAAALVRDDRASPTPR